MQSIGHGRTRNYVVSGSVHVNKDMKLQGVSENHLSNLDTELQIVAAPGHEVPSRCRGKQ